MFTFYLVLPHVHAEDMTRCRLMALAGIDYSNGSIDMAKDNSKTTTAILYRNQQINMQSGPPPQKAGPEHEHKKPQICHSGPEGSLRINHTITYS